MSGRQASQTGFVLIAAFSMLVVAGSALIAAQRSWTNGSPSFQRVEWPSEDTPIAIESTRALPRAADTHGAAVAPSAAVVSLSSRLFELAARDPSDDNQAEMARIADEFAGHGDVAATLLVTRIDALRGAAETPQRDRLLDVLRRIPGHVAEERLINEARAGSADSSRSLAIDALAERRSQRAIDELIRLAKTDGELPEKPLVIPVRDSRDTSTVLPDEIAFTPRVQAITALALTGDRRAAAVLTGVLREGRDEGLRMEAARHLEGLRDVAGTIDALRSALIADPSPYVRLAALHALAGSKDAALAPMLERVAARDVDAGVRALAAQVLAAIVPE